MSTTKFNCDYCHKPSEQPTHQYKRKKRHFCQRSCYSAYRRDIMPPKEQNAWTGGVSPQEARQRWNKKNKDKLNAMRRQRLIRERSAPGSHTEAEWEAVKKAQGYKCVGVDGTCRCPEGEPLTKDHKIPLIMGGSNSIKNIQGLGRPCNSYKKKKLYLESVA